jgi:dipeptidyl aminopeptidase/acylaminoacyl peptidase
MRKEHFGTTRKIIIVTIIAVLINCKERTDRALSTAAIAVSGIPPIADAIKRQVACYQNWQYATFVDWDPSGNGVIVFSRSGEISQLYRIEKPSGGKKQLTVAPEPVIDAAICPNGDTPFLLFTQDIGGNENFQIFRLDGATNVVTAVTADLAQNGDIVFSNRGDRFAYSSNRRNGTDFDVCVANVNASAPPVQVCGNGGMWSACDWSPDDKRLLVGTYVSRTSSLLYICDLEKGICVPMNDTADTVSQECGIWGEGGGGVFYTSDKNTDVRCLHYYDCTTKGDTRLTDKIPWDVREIACSHDRKTVAFTTNEHGFSQLYLMDARTFVYRKTAALPRGIIGHLRFRPSDRSIAMMVTTASRPDDVYELNLQNMAVTRWTDNTPEFSGNDSTVVPSVISYPTFDSVAGRPRSIPCLVYKPVNKKPPYPVVISLHGGPESQFWPSFNPALLFYLNELGIAVLAPNVRGSGGYGKKYLTLDDGMHREDAVKDIGALLSWIPRQSDLDSSRVVVTGGSYGGYLSLAAMVHYDEKLQAGVDCYGIGNFITFLEKTASYRRDLRRVEYGDERIPEVRNFLEKISPINHADKISKPVLIIQGANDARVPLNESEQMVATLRKKGNTVWFFVANDEGHGFRRKSNKDFQELLTAEFLRRFLVR